MLLTIIWNVELFAFSQVKNLSKLRRNKELCQLERFSAGSVGLTFIKENSKFNLISKLYFDDFDEVII